MDKARPQEPIRALGEMLAETAAAFHDTNTTTTSNPSEADVDGEGE